MRAAMLIIAAATVGLAGCGQDQTVNEAVAGDANLAAETIASNDTTAIDAATGDDANMAEDSSVMLEEVANDSANGAEATGADNQSAAEAPADNAN